jgi:hypothetical protein
MKQAVGYRRVFSHRLHLLIDFEAQTDKPPPLSFEAQNKETVTVILWVKSPNRSYRF